MFRRKFSTADLSPPYFHRYSTVIVFPPYRYFHRFSTVDSTVDTSLPLIHHSTIITLVTVRHMQIMLCSQSIYIKLNFSKFHSYNNITLLFLHRSLPLTGISNLPSPFIPLSFSECHAPTVVTSKIVERKTKKRS